MHLRRIIIRSHLEVKPHGTAPVTSFGQKQAAEKWTKRRPEPQTFGRKFTNYLRKQRGNPERKPYRKEWKNPRATSNGQGKLK
uniref:Uncharacterized protein n=1 Tax=Anopheles atroparvus TaxID=41427 RepID=A0AAG5D8W1_ANOAO